MGRRRTLRIGPVRIAWTDAPPGRGERRSVADELLRRTSISAGAGHDVAVSRSCQVCGSSEHGMPVVAGEPIAVSLSYAGSLVVAAAVPWQEAASVGIDIEHAERDVGDLEALFAPSPAPDLAGWTRIEAIAKADGRGLRLPPSSILVGTEAGRLPGSRRVVAPSGFDVLTTHDVTGYVVSLAVADAPRTVPSRG